MKKQNLKQGCIRKSYSILCFCIVILGNLFFSGCAEMAGYSNESLFPTDVDTVYLEMFDNQTFRRGAEYELSDALSKRIEVDTPYKIVSSRDRADTVISGQIVSIGEMALSTERETGLVLEKEIAVQRVIPDVDIGPVILVVVSPGHATAVAVGNGADPGSVRDILKDEPRRSRVAIEIVLIVTRANIASHHIQVYITI